MTNLLHWIIAHVPPWLWIAFVVHFGTLGTIAYLILLERKIASWVQDRIGPNRTGLGFGIIPFLKDLKLFGLGQPMADGLKFFVKEDYSPKNVDKILFTIAPGIMFIVVVLSIATLPWGGVRQATVDSGYPIPAGARVISEAAGQVTYQWDFQIARLNIGVLYIVAVLSLAVYGIVIGGWASNNKFSFLGGLRATANMISYEIPLGLCILAIVLMFGTLDLNTIVANQAHYWLGIIPAWNIFTQPLAFVMFLVCIHAEANRAPFDLAEAEQELVGGYHTEYSSMRFALFFLSEYAGMITTSCVCAALFFGGWHIPWLDRLPLFNQQPNASDPSITTSIFVCIVRALVFYAKALFVIFIFMWTRWSLPRFRFDQLMNLAWRGMIPISLALTLATAVVVWISSGATLGGVGGKEAIELLVMNGIILVAMLIGAKLIPAAPPTNRRVRVANSRFNQTAGVAALPA